MGARRFLWAFLVAGALTVPVYSIGCGPLAAQAGGGHAVPAISDDAQLRPGLMPSKRSRPRDEPGGAPSAPADTDTNPRFSTSHVPSLGMAPAARDAVGHSGVTDTAPTAPLPDSADVNPHVSDAGLKIRALSDAERHALGIAEGGLKVVGVRQGKAQQAGFRPGDVLLMLDGVEVKNPVQFHQLMRQLPHDRPVPVLVRRPNNSLFLPLDAPQR